MACAPSAPLPTIAASAALPTIAASAALPTIAASAALPMIATPGADAPAAAMNARTMENLATLWALPMRAWWAFWTEMMDPANLGKSISRRG